MHSVWFTMSRLDECYIIISRCVTHLARLEMFTTDRVSGDDRADISTPGRSYVGSNGQLNLANQRKSLQFRVPSTCICRSALPHCHSFHSHVTFHVSDSRPSSYWNQDALPEKSSKVIQAIFVKNEINKQFAINVSI